MRSVHVESALLFASLSIGVHTCGDIADRDPLTRMVTNMEPESLDTRETSNVTLSHRKEDLEEGGASAQLNDPQDLYTGSRELNINVGERRRTYVLHVPPSYERTKRTPLLVAFHGRLGTGRLMEKMTGFSRLSDEHNFIAVYPDGVSKSWNAGLGLGVASKLNVDDVGFVDRLLDLLMQEFAIDPHRIYLTGMSNGAALCYRLACELRHPIAAFAAVAGPEAVQVAQNCHPRHSISMLVIYGTADRIAQWDSSGPGLTGSATVQRWIEVNKCASRPRVTLQVNQVRVETYRPCDAGVEVSVCRIEGGGHTWPGAAPLPGWESVLGPTNQDISASDLIWSFFSQHSLSTSVSLRWFNETTDDVSLTSDQPIDLNFAAGENSWLGVKEDTSAEPYANESKGRDPRP